MKRVAGFIASMVFSAIVITVFWFNISDIIYHADTTFGWIMVILSGIIVHVAPIGILRFYLKGLGYNDPFERKNKNS